MESINWTEVSLWYLGMGLWVSPWFNAYFEHQNVTKLYYFVCLFVCLFFVVVFFSYEILAALRVVSLVPFNFNNGTIRYYWYKLTLNAIFLLMATYLKIVPMAYRWLAFWSMIIYMELLWMFISIIFHIADSCSLSYR